MTDHQRLTSIVGSSFYMGAGGLIGRLRPGAQLLLKRQPTNKYDANAIAVHWGSKILGHIPRGLAAELAPLMDAGTEITVSKQTATWGVVGLTWQTHEVEDVEADPAL